MKRADIRRNGGFTLTEVLIAVGIIAALSVMIFSVFGVMEERGRSTACILNLRQISAATRAYQAENRNQWPENRASPGAVAFSSPLLPYLGPYPRAADADAPYQLQRGVFVCPADRFGVKEKTEFENVYAVGSPRYPLSYGQNGYLTSTSSAYGAGAPSAVTMPGRLATHMDWEGHYIANLQTLMTNDGERKRALLKRHNGKINVIFADGHAEQWRIESLPNPVPPPEPFWTGRESGPMP